MNTELLKKFSYASLSNCLNMLTSVCSIFFLPKFLSPEILPYAYYQLFRFYCSYAGVTHLGLVDGIYLREGGNEYDTLNFGCYAAQLRFFVLWELFLGFGIVVFSFIYLQGEYLFIAFMVALNLVIVCSTHYFFYIFQATNQIKEYSIALILGRLGWLLLLCGLIVFDVKDFRGFIFLDISSNFIMLLIGIYYGRRILFSKCENIYLCAQQFWNNIQIGFPLLVANISGMLVTGITRWEIQQEWGVAIYGKISLSLSACNALSVFTDALAMVLYPTLRRKDHNSLLRNYDLLYQNVILALFGMLIFCYPIQKLLIWWLPAYEASIQYLSLLFPISVLSVKSSILIQTFMKVLRMEKTILYSNLFSVIFSSITTTICIFHLHNFNAAICAMVFNVLFRNTIAEIFLHKHLGISYWKAMLLQGGLVVIFMCTSWYMRNLHGIMIYFLAWILCFLGVSRKIA